MKHSTTWGKRAIAAAGVAALTLPALAGTATAAVGTGETIDEAKDGASSIQIYKYDSDGVEGSKSGAALTGTTKDKPTKASPLQGVVFTAYKVCVDPDGGKGATGFHAIDLKNASDWDLIKDVTASNVKAKDATPAAESTAPFFRLCDDGTPFAATDQEGQTKLSNLNLALYLVRETSKPADMVISDTTDDFLVTLPLANTDAATKADTPWLYDVVVYPKNTLGTAASKTMKSDSKIGAVASSTDSINWQISVPITKVDSQSEYFTALKIEDTLDAAFGDATKIKNIIVKADTVTLAEDTDYSVSKDGQKLTIEFIKTVDKSDPVDGSFEAIGVSEGQTVTLEFTTPYTANKASTNTFTATLTDDKGKTSTITPPPAKKPVIAEGSFTITKTDEERTSKKLKGAQFKVCEANAGGNGCAQADTYVREAEADSDKIFETAADGTVSGTLLINKGEAGTILNKDNNTPDDTSDDYAEKMFCAVEVQAPKGYSTDPTAHCFTVSSKTGAANAAVAVTNVQSGKGLVPFLPTTGAQGLVLLTLGGAALAAIAVGSALVIRRRQA